MTSAVRLAVGHVCWNAATDEHSELTTVLRGFVRYVPCTLFEKKEGLYWTNRITSCSGNSRRLWKSMSSLLRRGKSTATKPSSSITADKLAQFFADKVAAVRSETKDAPSPTFTQRSGTQLSSFNEASAVDVRRVLTSSPAKTCTLDPLPTSVLLDVVDVLLPFSCVMCNTSLREGCLPSSQKKAIITPVLKKQNADPDEPKKLPTHLQLNIYIQGSREDCSGTGHSAP